MSISVISLLNVAEAPTRNMCTDTLECEWAECIHIFISLIPWLYLYYSIALPGFRSSEEAIALSLLMVVAASVKVD